MFTVESLFNSWFGRLDLSSLDIGQSKFPSYARDPDWRCAVDKKSTAMVFQLIGTIDQMKDDYYTYVLTIGSRMYVAESSGGKIRLCPDRSPITNLPEDPAELFLLTNLVRQGAHALLEHARKPKISRLLIAVNGVGDSLN